MIGVFESNKSYGQCGDTIDFNSWSQFALARNGNWVPSNIVNGQALSVKQTINGEPTFFVSPETFINVEIMGEIKLGNTFDNDWVGFVFGYKNPLNTSAKDTASFYLLDWKSSNQNNIYSPYTGVGKEGYALSKVNGVFDWQNQASFSPYFWWCFS